MNRGADSRCRYYPDLAQARNPTQYRLKRSPKLLERFRQRDARHPMVMADSGHRSMPVLSRHAGECPPFIRHNDQFPDLGFGNNPGIGSIANWMVGKRRIELSCLLLNFRDRINETIHPLLSPLENVIILIFDLSVYYSRANDVPIIEMLGYEIPYTRKRGGWIMITPAVYVRACIEDKQHI